MRALLISAHPDDAEISCGGTIDRLKNAGWIIHSVYFCPCTEDPRNVNHLEEHKQVVKRLRINALGGFEFPKDTLEQHKQDVRDILWGIKEQFHPDLVLCPSVNDLHQDHTALAECCVTIFRREATILGYEVVCSSSAKFNANVFVTLTPKNVGLKMEALSLYKSQMENRKHSFRLDAIHGALLARGLQAGAEFAEAFELLWGRV